MRFPSTRAISFHRKDLDKIKNTLNEIKLPPYTFYSKKEAAVLVPLCTINGKPSILFTIRSMGLRTHNGEVSFPGGRKDPDDETLLDTALRETHEEIGIQPKKVQILGKFISVPNKTGDTKVTSFIGYLGEIDPVKLAISPDEVSKVFTQPIDELLRTCKQENFRNTNIMIPNWRVESENVQIWGLTAYILGKFLENIIIKSF